MDKRWDVSVLGDIADVYSGRDIYAQERVDGDIPYVTAGTTNNGIGFFVGNDNDSKAKDSISVSRNGAGVGTAFYHPYEALFGNDCRRFVLKQNIGFGAHIYITKCIHYQRKAFSYSRKLGTARLKKLRIMLPVEEKGKPDWEYMEQTVKIMRVGLLARYKAYVLLQLSKLKFNAVPDTKDVKWGQFRIGSLFTVKRPKARNKDDYDFGDIPFVASGAMNNGVMKCCSPKPGETLDQGGCITVSPVDGSAFYQPIDFLGRGGAGSSVLMLYSKAINAYSGHFVAKMISQTCSKYTYGHMGNKDSIKRDTVMLPVAPSGEPDWEYMEQYAKNLMKRKYEQYLAYLDGSVV